MLSLKKNLLILLAIWSLPVFAQYHYANYQLYSAKDGFQFYETYGRIYKDREKFVWIPTDNGLFRFDGQNFKVYRRSPDNKSHYSYNFFQSIYQDRQKNYWVTSYEGRLFHFDGMTGKFTEWPGKIALATHQYVLTNTPQHLIVDDAKFFPSEIGYSTQVCGDFRIDPKHAATDPYNPGEFTKKAERKSYAAEGSALNSIHIFPNPVSNVVTIQSNELILSACIMDMSGKTVKTALNIHSRTLKLSTSELPGGTYFIKLVKKNSVSTHKIITRK